MLEMAALHLAQNPLAEPFVYVMNKGLLTGEAQWQKDVFLTSNAFSLSVLIVRSSTSKRSDQHRYQCSPATKRSIAQRHLRDEALPEPLPTQRKLTTNVSVSILLEDPQQNCW